MAVQEIIRRIGDIEKKVDGLLTSPPSSRKSLPLPDGMQKSVLAVVKKLQDLEENPLVLDFTSFINNDCERVVTEVQRLFKDQKWGTGTLAEAFKRVWRNIRDAENRKKTGKFDLHKENSKRNKRIRIKLQRRTESLQKMDWSPAKKSRVEKTLTMAMTSPEVSKPEGKWERTPFAWESSRLAKVKLDLDECYQANLNFKARRQLVLSEEGSRCATSAPPSDAESWTISRQYEQ